MKSYLVLVLLACLVFCQKNTFCQTPLGSIVCGKGTGSEFTSNKESHEIKIELQAETRLNFTATPVGDYLNMRVELYDPSGGLIYPPNLRKYREPMFTDNLRILDVTTGRLSATGTYTIKVFNNYRSYRRDARAGKYTFSTKCIR